MSYILAGILCGTIGIIAGYVIAWASLGARIAVLEQLLRESNAREGSKT